MAIDSAEKRRSAAGVPFLPLGPGVTPNASKDAEWRAQVAWGYSGIAVAVAVPTGLVCASITLTPAVTAAVYATAAVTATGSVAPAVTAVVDIRKC